MRTPALITALIATLLSLALAQPSPAPAEEPKVIVVDESGAYRNEIRKPNPDTKVISLKNVETPEHPEPQATVSTGVCDTLEGKYYCANLGLTAVELTTGEPLGEIIGVAWKGKGEAVTRYLPPDWLMRDSGNILEINAPVGGEGFFYIIKGEGMMTFLVECQRIGAETD
ncbi:hypothetical protein LCGC14_2806970 [marine sediment metagenome]|uniref:Uncharacterized protein n=1 Tax=marine sediment metagenome TaxID=412755 RepID=A0A0F9AUF8_9ZZZZ